MCIHDIFYSNQDQSARPSSAVAFRESESHLRLDKRYHHTSCVSVFNILPLCLPHANTFLVTQGGVVHTVQTHERRAAFHVVSQTKSGSSAVDPGTKSCTFMCKCIVFVRVNSPRDFIHGKSIPPRFVTAVVIAYFSELFIGTRECSALSKNSLQSAHNSS